MSISCAKMMLLSGFPIANRPRGRGFTFDVSHLTWMCPEVTTAKYCEARKVAGIEG
jgi:hypothetical protein